MQLKRWLGGACVVIAVFAFAQLNSARRMPERSQAVTVTAPNAGNRARGFARRGHLPVQSHTTDGSPTQSSLEPDVSGATVSASLPSQIIDVYEPSTRILTIPLVQYRERYYRDLQVKLAYFNPALQGQAISSSGVFDRFDSTGSRLTVPVLRSGTTLYYNNSFEVERVLNVPPRVDSFTVPLDLASVSYPSSYQTVTTNAADVSTDPCNLALTRITYPASWRGQYPLPPINGGPLATAIGRAVIFKDIGLAPSTNPAFILPNAPGAPAGCTGSLQSELAKTTQRLHVLGADEVEVTQWHWASAHPDGSWYFTTAESTYGSISDADLSLLVQKAHAQGLKVIMKNQIQGFRDDPANGPTYTPASTQANYQKWFAAYDAYIIERASIFQQMGIDAWEVGCSACLYGDSGDGSPATISYFISQYQLVLDHMKAAYNGKTTMSTTLWLYQTPAFASRIDIIEFLFMGVPPPDPNAALSVASYKAVIAQRLQGMGFNLYDPLGKTYIIDIGIQSRSNMFTLPGYLEETACTSGLGTLDTSADACAEREAVTDFSMQAIVMEATLEAINEFPWQSPPIVAVGDYWQTDSLMPFTAFPNIAYSVRNKPAEGILKWWFAR